MKQELNEQFIINLSKSKHEPEWMLNFRLQSYAKFLELPEPNFGPELKLDFNQICYYNKVNVIAIFNTNDENEIDSTLLESNNLLRTLYFEYLSEDESNELSEHLNNKKSHKTKSRLIDIVKNTKKPKCKKFGL
jgi:Fe-S cluster assembly scaffold protein SufB